MVSQVIMATPATLCTQAFKATLTKLKFQDISKKVSRVNKVAPLNYQVPHQTLSSSSITICLDLIQGFIDRNI